MRIVRAWPSECEIGDMSTTAPGHIVLVGLPGAGKSTVGNLLAYLLGRPFVDFDAEIERREARSVTEIFANEGEAHFRALELALTTDIANESPAVLAPGGGWIAQPGALALLPHPRRIIHLRVSPATAALRVSASGEERPLLAGGDRRAALERLLEERVDYYMLADSAVDTEGLTAQQVAALVMDALGHAARPG